MPKSKDETPEQQLAAFLAKYSPEMIASAKAVRAKMRKLYPTALELVYDNYNALVIGYGATERASEFIFSIAIYPKWVNLFFAQGAGIPDPQKLLKGSGTAIRHIRLDSPALLDDPAVRALMKEAVSRADVPFDPKGTHRLVIKSISAKQRPRRPALPAAKSARAKEENLPKVVIERHAELGTQRFPLRPRREPNPRSAAFVIQLTCRFCQSSCFNASNCVEIRLFVRAFFAELQRVGSP